MRIFGGRQSEWQPGRRDGWHGQGFEARGQQGWIFPWCVSPLPRFTLDVMGSQDDDVVGFSVGQATATVISRGRWSPAHVAANRGFDEQTRVGEFVAGD